jgi:hypothetical protein
VEGSPRWTRPRPRIATSPPAPAGPGPTGSGRRTRCWPPSARDYRPFYALPAYTTHTAPDLPGDAAEPSTHHGDATVRRTDGLTSALVPLGDVRPTRRHPRL